MYASDLRLRVTNTVRSLERRASSTSTAAHASVRAYYLYAITGLASINKVIIHHNLDRPRQLTSRRAFWHLLNHDLLMIHVCRQPEFSFKWIALGVFLRICR